MAKNTKSPKKLAAANLKMIYGYNFIVFIAVLFFSSSTFGVAIALIALMLSFYEIGKLTKKLEK